MAFKTEFFGLDCTVAISFEIKEEIFYVADVYFNEAYIISLFKLSSACVSFQFKDSLVIKRCITVFHKLASIIRIFHESRRCSFSGILPSCKPSLQIKEIKWLVNCYVMHLLAGFCACCCHYTTDTLQAISRLYCPFCSIKLNKEGQEIEVVK